VGNEEVSQKITPGIETILVYGILNSFDMN